MPHPNVFVALTLSFSAVCLGEVRAVQRVEAGDVRGDQKGTYLGILFGPRTVARISETIPSGREPKPTQTPAQRTTSGVVITHVLGGSPAASGRLQRGDVLLRYDHTTVRDTEHLTRLIRADKPNRTITLVVQRGERLKLVDVTLAWGPELLPAPVVGKGDREAGLPSVSVLASPLESGKVRLTIEYQAAGEKKKVTTCEGEAGELAELIGKLPQREQSLVRIALERLNRLGEKKETGKR